MKRGVWVFVLFILVFANFSAASHINNSIPIQIQALTDAGVAATGTFTFKIEISNSPTCSPVLYTNTTTATTDARGIVTYNLEDVNLDFNEQYWFCYYRDGVLKSTIKAARVPYAFSAKSVPSSGIVADSNIDLGSYNITASHFVGDGSQLTGVALSGSGDSLWINSSGTATYSGNVNIEGNLTLGGTVTGQNISRVIVSSNSQQSISSGSESTIIFNNEELDVLDEYNPSNGRFTAKESGYYYVTTSVAFGSASWGAGNLIIVSCYKNSSEIVLKSFKAVEASITTFQSISVSNLVYLNVGDYIYTSIYQNSGGSRLLHPDADFTYLTITQLKQEINIGGGSSNTSYVNSIVASGNNSNGSYIKFIDGTMIAWGNVSGTTTNAVAGMTGWYYTNGVNINFPVNFIDSPSLSYSIKPTGDVLTITAGMKYNSLTNSGAQVFFTAYSYGQSINGYWTAVGKWTNTPYDNSTITVGGGIPSGAIVAFNKTSCPVGWTLADGSSGTPDLRGIFIRGSGTNSILKYANGTYFSSILGTYRNDSFQGHAHVVSLGDSATLGGSNFYAASRPGISNSLIGVFGYGIQVVESTDGVPRDDAETTPAYYSTIYCVKMTEDTATSNTIWATSGSIVQLSNSSMNVNIQNSKVRARRDTVQSISAGVITIIQYDNETFDTLNEWNGSRFTATQAGYYHVNARASCGVSTWVAGNSLSLWLYKNNIQYSLLGSHLSEAASSTSDLHGVNGEDTVYLNAGEYIDVRVYSGPTTALYANGAYNHIEITKVP